MKLRQSRSILGHGSQIAFPEYLLLGVKKVKLNPNSFFENGEVSSK